MALILAFASPVDSRTVRVFFNREPRAHSPLGASSARNVANWSIELVSGPPRASSPVVMVAPRLVEDPLNGFGVDLVVDRRLVSGAVYRVTGSAAIESAPPLETLTAPLEVDFPGILPLPPREQVAAVEVRPSEDVEYDTFSGKYVLDSKLDLSSHGGEASLRKRIIRRVLSTPGGFRVLPGDYGVGLKPKKTVRGRTSLARLQLDVRDQVLAEEDVEAARVDVDKTGAVLIVRVMVVPRALANFTLRFTVPVEGAIVIGEE